MDSIYSELTSRYTQGLAVNPDVEFTSLNAVGLTISLISNQVILKRAIAM